MVTMVTDLSGFWAGTIIQGSNTARVFVNFAVQDGAITGSFEVPTSPSEYRTGTFTGTLSGDSITVTLSGSDSVQFDLRVIQNDGEYMIFGYTTRAGAFPRFATVTLFRFGPLFRLIAGIWP